MIAVVGGGITGLLLGLELQRLGEEFVVFEAADRPGGVIRSLEADGRVLDWGPQRTRLTRGVGKLIDELGLNAQVIAAPPDLGLFVYAKGRLRRVPFTAGAFIRSDVVSPGAKLRLLLEPLTPGADPGERVARYFTRKLGREIYETLVAPLYGGLYASDPADMEVGLSLGHVLQEFGVGRSLLIPLMRRGGAIRPPAACSFREGMQALPVAIASGLGERLQLSAPVRGLRRRGTGWCLQLDEYAVDAERVVITTPAPVAAALLGDVAPVVAAALASLRYNPLAVIHLDAATDLRGLGFQVAFTEADLTLRGVTFNDSLFGRRNLYTAYLGGSKHPEVADMAADSLAALATREFRTCTGHEATPLCVEVERMPAWDLTWRALDGLDPPKGIAFAANWWSRPGIPGRLAEAKRTASMLHRRGKREGHE